MPTTTALQTSSVTIQDKSKIASYAGLRKAVRNTISAGKERALRAVEREKVRTSWEVGKLILEHVLLNEKRGNYGSEVIKRLAADLGISTRELQYMVEFARTYPKMRTSAQLSWGHYQALLAVNDDVKRAVIAEKAVQGDWPVKRLRSEIRKIKGASDVIPAEAGINEPQRGIPYTYRIVTKNNALKIDLGFSCYLRLSKKDARRFREGDIVQARSRSNRFTLHPSRFTLHDIYTYHASLLEVTDADTIWVYVDLGFGITTMQQLRFRGIDAPEINTHAGIEAKAYVGRVLKKAKSIIVRTSKSDKYDRYLADVWYGKKYKPARSGKASAGSTWLTKAKYLNQELINKGFAVRVED